MENTKPRRGNSKSMALSFETRKEEPVFLDVNGQPQVMWLKSSVWAWVVGATIVLWWHVMLLANQIHTGEKGTKCWPLVKSFTIYPLPPASHTSCSILCKFCRWHCEVPGIVDPHGTWIHASWRWPLTLSELGSLGNSGSYCALSKALGVGLQAVGELGSHVVVPRVKPSLHLSVHLHILLASHFVFGFPLQGNWCGDSANFCFLTLWMNFQLCVFFC